MSKRINKNHAEFNHQSGFSLIELMIVILIISILTVLSVMSMQSGKKYLTDSEAYEITDILHEARQRALTQRETMRVEFDQTRNSVLLISENEAGTAADDKLIDTLTLEKPANVALGNPPANSAGAPTEMTPTPTLTFKVSTHPLSRGDTVATLRFTKTGKVLNAGSDAIGTNSVMTGATVYLWMPDLSNSGQPLKTGDIIRAITIQGTSGITNYWKCSFEGETCKNWGR